MEKIPKKQNEKPTKNKVQKKAEKKNLMRKYAKATYDLAGLNRELATQMIVLATQTGNSLPLKQAVEALEAADHLYSDKSTPYESAEIRRALGDTLLALGRTHQDTEALERSICAYRSAITLSSLLGQDKMRHDLRKNYHKARDLLKEIKPKNTLRGAA